MCHLCIVKFTTPSEAFKCVAFSLFPETRLKHIQRPYYQPCTSEYSNGANR